MYTDYFVPLFVAFYYEQTFDTLWLLANEVLLLGQSTHNECSSYLSQLVRSVSRTGLPFAVIRYRN